MEITTFLLVFIGYQAIFCSWPILSVADLPQHLVVAGNSAWKSFYRDASNVQHNVMARSQSLWRGFQG